MNCNVVVENIAGEMTYFADVTTVQSHVTIQRCDVLEAAITYMTLHRLRFTTQTDRQTDRTYHCTMPLHSLCNACYSVNTVAYTMNSMYFYSINNNIKQLVTGIQFCSLVTTYELCVVCTEQNSLNKA